MRHKSTELMGTIKAFVEEYYKNYRHSPSTTQIAEAMNLIKVVPTTYDYLDSELKKDGFGSRQHLEV